MTLRRRWTVSILAILGLFGLNLAVYIWGNARRGEIMDDLKTALERKDLAVEIRNMIDDRQRAAEVMEPLLASGAVRLSAEELAEVGEGAESIARLMGRLHDLSGSVETVRLTVDFERLQNAWLDVYRSAPSPPTPAAAPDPEEVGVDTDPESLEASDVGEEEASPPEEPEIPERPDVDFQHLHRELSVLLGELEASEAARARVAEREFSAVAKLTDRITLSIFVLSTLAAVGIAVWFSRFLRGTFSRYLTAEIVTSVLDTPTGMALGGEKREISVLMADLRGFSSIAERLPAENVVAVINNFLGTMTEVIVEAGGTIDEFIGDAILVFFGAPVARDDHAEAAVVCALKMQLAMADVNAKNQRDDLPAVEMGIGVHTGEVVVGNIGSEKRTKYGAVGASVNLVGRIEAHTVGGQILISEATRAAIDADLRIDGQVEIRPKGFDGPMALFDVGGIGGWNGMELPAPGDSLAPLSHPIAVRISVLEGKTSEGDAFAAELLSLSPRAALVRSTTAPAPLTDVKLEMPGAIGKGEPLTVYGKVSAGAEPEPGTFVLRFTSLTAETLVRLGRLAH